MRIRNLFDPGSWMEKIRIRDKHPGPATLIIWKTRIEILSKGASYSINQSIKDHSNIVYLLIKLLRE
jgi:hypothetical protein